MPGQSLKVATIVGTRPEIIKLSPTIKALDRYFEHVLIHTGQNWDFALNEVFFQDLGLRKPDHFLGVAGAHLGETIGNIISRSYEVLSDERPDALVVLGDTNSALATLSAKRLKIPIFHLEAGNRCFDENLPEEVNRRIVDHISDVNLPFTEHGRRYLLAEGIRKEFIFVTGSPMAEVLGAAREGIEASTVRERLGLEPDGYMLVSAHREENVDSERRFLSLMTAINDVAEEWGMPMIYSTHPRTMAWIEQRGFSFHHLVRILEPFGFFDYNRLQQDSFCVLSDSGTLAEESSILGFSGVSLRTSTERPEVLDAGSFVLGGITGEQISGAVRLVRSMAENGPSAPLPADYTDVNVSSKVVRLIQSYTGIVDRVIWQKDG